MSVISERTLYLSSEDLSSFGDSRIININIPTQLTNYKNTSKLKIIVNSFSAAKTWYTINEYNGIFYIADTNSDKFYECRIPDGNYTDLDDLNLILETIILDVLVEHFEFARPADRVDVTYDAISGHFTITLSKPALNIKFVSFSITGDFQAVPGSPLDDALNDIFNSPGKYNDVDQILGGQTNKTVAGLTNISQIKDLFDIETVNEVFISKFPGNLQTNDAIYLRISTLPTNNLQSTNLSNNFKENQIISSDILGKVLLPSDLTNQFITYLDYDENFSIDVQASQFSQLRISITDNKSRLIPTAVSRNGNEQSINYALSLKLKEYVN